MSNPSSEAIQFYLASASPRRRELLNRVGLHFEVVVADIDETVEPDETAGQCTARLALAKAGRAADTIARAGKPLLPILAADTCVSLDRCVMGKPTDRDHARAMLERLSARTHSVVTAVVVKLGDRVWQETSRTRVSFKRLASDEIDAYCNSPEPLGKAGAYAIQGLAAAFVKHIEGSYTGVVGLPMFETRRLLTRTGIDWL